MCQLLISYTHTTAPAWEFLEKYNINHLIFVRILENTNPKEKFLHKIVTTKCHNFALYHADDPSVFKGFANLAAVPP